MKHILILLLCLSYSKISAMTSDSGFIMPNLIAVSFHKKHALSTITISSNSENFEPSLKRSHKSPTIDKPDTKSAIIRLLEAYGAETRYTPQETFLQIFKSHYVPTTQEIKNTKNSKQSSFSPVG